MFKHKMRKQAFWRLRPLNMDALEICVQQDDDQNEKGKKNAVIKLTQLNDSLHLIIRFTFLQLKSIKFKQRKCLIDVLFLLSHS